MLANHTLSGIAKTGHSKLWLQLCPFTDQRQTEHLIKQAEELGFKAIMVTVDAQYLGKKKRDLRNHFALPNHLGVPNIQNASNAQFSAGSQSLFDKNLSWKTIEAIQKQTNLPIVLKGILHPEDAKRALNLGVNGLCVSNHGGRTLDCVIPSILILPQIKATVQDKIPVFLDGGIRTGTDVFKALALGADAVLIGRPILWGLAVQGKEGVKEVIEIFKAELDKTMALCGLKNIPELQKNGRQILANFNGAAS
jgi:isopentenyl diphosphate isomerase/L-lactate dehydrogenase-like FMN-dependent dehydrogenase